MRYLCLLIVVCWIAVPAVSSEPHYFRIQVVDAQSGRGIPLVELRAVDNVSYWTDSNGLVAFHDPALMGRKVFFYVSSAGYEYPKDSFGYAGLTLNVTAGQSARIEMRRTMVAERLYRITGEGIYADTVLLGEHAPIRQPLLNAQVTGQDSVLSLLYNGKIYWFWGDTLRPRYPLGNFRAAGATSDPHGLDPSVGIDLNYFTDTDGFARGMCPLPGPGVVWLNGLLTATDKSGRERMLVHFERQKSLTETFEQGIAIFNDTTGQFDKLTTLPTDEKWRRPREHPLRVDKWWYFLGPDRAMRAPADLTHLTDVASYEAFTCMDGSHVRHDNQGHALYTWVKGAEPIGQDQERALVQSGSLRRADAHFLFEDADSGKAVRIHNGSVYWNAYRKKWLFIGEEVGGSSSYLGEVWLALADSPLGPWRRARKIMTSDRFSFYNPKQHPFFDQDGGRLIYFEGTYSQTFSNAAAPTPRYDYNQIMYRVDLSDPRLRDL